MDEQRTILRCAYCCAPFGRQYARQTHCSLHCALWNKVAIGLPDECWPWAGASSHGYGSIRYQNKPYVATRLIYEWMHGPFDKSLFVCHSCDNPPCCNPAHLWLGSDADNKADMLAKNRWTPPPARVGMANNKAKLTDEDVSRIRERLACNRYGDVITLAREYGVTKRCIGDIKFGRTWKHVQR